MKYADDLRILEAPVSHYLSDFSTGDKPQQAQVVSPREPVVVKLEDFFRIADSVVLVKVVSGDTENYSTAIYKAEVLRSFKGGTAARAAIYFGPYIGMRLGGDYILFLRNVRRPLAPNPDSTSNYGAKGMALWRHPTSAFLTARTSLTNVTMP